MTGVPPQNRRRYLGIGLVALAFALGTLFWIFYFPFRPSLVLRVAPPEATVVSWHLQPSGRVDALLRSAPVALLLAAGEVSVADAAAAVEAPGVQALLKRLAGTGMTLAFAPEYGRRGTPALFLGSWVGGVTTHLMRGGWLDKAFDGFTVYRIGRDRVWSGYFPELPAGMQQVSFGVYEGVLAGCASADPLAAVPLLFALRRHGPLSDLAESLAGRVDGGGVSDHVHARFEDASGVASTWTGEFDLRADGMLVGQLVQDGAYGNGSWFAGGGWAHGVLAAGLRDGPPIPAGLPAALVAMALECGVMAGEALLVSGSREQALLNVLSGMAARDAGFCVWVSGGDYSGRLMRLKVPSAGFALQVGADTRVDAAAARLADALNSLYGTGLIAVPDRKNPDIQVFRPVKDAGVLAFLSAEERPALALAGGWLIGMSNVEVLRRVLAAGPSASGGWAVDADLERTWVHGHSRLPALGGVAGNAMAGYALLRLLQTGNAERLDTPVVKRVLAGMETLGTCTLHAGIDPQGRFALFFKIDGQREDGRE